MRAVLIILGILLLAGGVWATFGNGRLCLPASLRGFGSTASQSAFADTPVICAQTEPVVAAQTGSEHP